ncbi:MAG: hypothetical protein FJ316_11130 [SAR202 cluster bacterium]|nr:hypothetical protein [SAR202 cluster bacterium]
MAVKAGGEHFQTRILIIADGVNGVAARLAGIAVPRTLGIALEGNIAMPPDALQEWRAALGVDSALRPLAGRRRGQSSDHF